jgi:2'-5' RNA ligase
MRIFIALDIPEEIRERIGQYAQRVRPLAPDSRWSKPDALHVTLKFVGETSDARVEEMKQALRGISYPPFEIGFGGVGFFPGEKSARVFWAGVEFTEALPGLASAIDTALKKIGIPRENRPYRPHLTLARASEKREANRAFQQLPRNLPAEIPQFGTMTAQEFILYKSEPMPGGSRYTRLERYPLKGAS